ncbi:MAG TPA: lysine transporter LysE [Gammaproteobacteria bacterium]|jgi:threonine/homoserine/homoserine lactone efflux protein|nr:LysE family transporter [Gammaproteobacteria bacterium]MDP6732953.1 LysE family transporter [Gammaproteobacteria bacterium]HAJ74928.1 lysine transporter LysE [Gammaproteobacteria bacterium]|tara:strand:- start:73 stop:696 length:624 start_codon:yes stop_codon:yes gene_type:complete
MYWTEFLTIAIAHLFAVASPGPDFAVVTRQCVTGGTKAGLWTSFGVGTGILLHVAYCILGVALILSQSPALFNTMKYLASAYILYLGVQSIRRSMRVVGQASAAAIEVNVQPGKAFVLGFLTNGLNPKATLFFLALFTVVISSSTPIAIQMMYGIYLAIATFAWFAMLSKIFGRQSVRDWLLSAGVWFERAMGFILILLALQITVNT